MRGFTIILVLGIVLSTHAASSQRKLIPRCTNGNKQLMRGEVTVTQVFESCTVATQTIKQSCNDKDSVKLQESVSSVQVYVVQLKTIVETFDGQHAMEHKTTVVGIFATYFSMIDTISKTKDGKQVCQNQLVQINEAFLSISSVYAAMGIDLRGEFKRDSDYNEDAFKQLDLSPPFAQKDAAPSDVQPKDTTPSDVQPQDTTPSDAQGKDATSSDVQEKDATPSSAQAKDAAPSDAQDDSDE
ncbi:uncharacterized protein PGTG_16240 [Puccinia graminis f. sp. tritici CRL 75-36-700-3]|uniref:Secreted protein n=1 Tax=Puccinia graminis f. sp. tritici (strain CRL 75-36-700-3 / race SCCL) TaxID=418459 RepID=E3L065_PUCGT|nr:uncharacterized protein PGTG_16240 [Puccinia graminis f. sp. tritici CRL 75-36-700-3]EFP89952.1 hypothetical protein PGTG_16240 [Puccinia graminis f. sp. tritici CRL 75-36-700-3]